MPESPPSGTPPLTSKALYRAQRTAERPSALFYVLLGMASAGRQAVHKAAGACTTDPAAAPAVEELDQPGKEAPPLANDLTSPSDPPHPTAPMTDKGEPNG